MNNETPLVSVLVTPYNQQDYIRQTLDSILNQVCDFPFELLIGEDCSTDQTRAICIEYAERFPDRIVLVLNKQNKGLIDNYFDLFLKARGRYLADCGGDDYWQDSGKLQEQVRLLEQYPQASMVTGNWESYHQATGKRSPAHPWLETDCFLPDEFGPKAIANYLNHPQVPRVVLSASCFRGDWAREVYHAHPELFRGSTVVCEDLPLTLGLLMKGPIYYSKHNWLTYRVLQKSLSHSEQRSQYLSGFAFHAFRQTLRLLEVLNIPISDCKPYAKEKAEDFILHAFLSGDKEWMQRLGSLGNLPIGWKSRLLFALSDKPRWTGLLKFIYSKRYPNV